MCELTIKCYAELQQTKFCGSACFLEKIKLDISCELSALIKFYFFFLKNKKLNTLTLLELYFIHVAVNTSDITVEQ